MKTTRQRLAEIRAKVLEYRRQNQEAKYLPRQLMDEYFALLHDCAREARAIQQEKEREQAA